MKEKNKNLLIIALAVSTFVLLVLVSYLTVFSLNIENNKTTNDNNTTIFNNTKKNIEPKQEVKKTIKSAKPKEETRYEDGVYKTKYYVGPNEKGQLEGVEPGWYEETWDDDGPISVRKLS